MKYRIYTDNNHFDIVDEYIDAMDLLINIEREKFIKAEHRNSFGKNNIVYLNTEYVIYVKEIDDNL